MPDQTILKEPEQKSRSKTMSWVNIGIFFSTIGMVIFVLAFGYGYYQLSRINMALSQAVLAAKDEASQASQHVNDLQQRVLELQQEMKTVQEKVNEKQTVAANDPKTLELYSRLTSMDNQVEQLPFLMAQPKALVLTDSGQEAAIANAQGDASVWRQNVEHMRTWLGKFVKVSYVGSEVPVTTLPESKTYAYQSLHSQLQAAMWAVLHHHPAIYRESLTRAAETINRYFEVDAAETKQMQTELQALLSVPMNAQENNANIQSSASATTTGTL